MNYYQNIAFLSSGQASGNGLRNGARSGRGKRGAMLDPDAPTVEGNVGVERLAQNVARNCGYAVFPCRDDKRPATPHGFKDATADPEGVVQLWNRCPGPLTGVATGKLSGIAVLDVDVDGNTGRAWWRENEHRIPATRTYRTRSGGLHLFFHYADGLKSTTAKPVDGIDVRADGGYVIFWFAAGYPCLDHSPATEWPRWLREAIWPPPPTYTSAPAQRASNPRPGGGENALVGILRSVREAREKTRNSVLYWAAHRMHERITASQLTPSTARTALIDAARCAGLSRIEADRTIASAWRAA